MNILDNYIFYSICEKAYELFIANTYYQTFGNFCNSFNTSIKLNNLNKKELAQIYILSDYLEKIYGLSSEECNLYIADFFLLEKWVRFEMSVRMMNTYFKNSLN